MALGLIQHGFPDMALERHELLERKAAQDAGRNLARDLRGLDHHGAAAAAGVVQRLGVVAMRVPAEAAIMAAARVSLSGASPLSSRQPRLNSASPEVSI
jgi:hypothetical protein